MLFLYELQLPYKVLRTLLQILHILAKFFTFSFQNHATSRSNVRRKRKIRRKRDISDSKNLLVESEFVESEVVVIEAPVYLQKLQKRLYFMTILNKTC